MKKALVSVLALAILAAWAMVARADGDRVLRSDARDWLASIPDGRAGVMVFDQIDPITHVALRVERTKEGWMVQPGFVRVFIVNGVPQPIFGSDLESKLFKTLDALMAFICETFDVRERPKEIKI